MKSKRKAKAEESFPVLEKTLAASYIHEAQKKRDENQGSERKMRVNFPSFFCFALLLLLLPETAFETRREH